MVIGLLAIVWRGAAYVPVDVEWPAGRANAVLDDCQPSVLLSLERHPVPPSFQGRVVRIDGCHTERRHADEQAAAREVDLAQELLYIMYTSGTTGKPKGVMVEQGALVNRVRWLQATFPLEATDGVLQKCSYGFGVSEWEIFWPLCHGARLVLAKPGGHKDPLYLSQLIQDTVRALRKATQIRTTPVRIHPIGAGRAWHPCAPDLELPAPH
eukprot:6701734-Prymnesium_polylepis.1